MRGRIEKKRQNRRRIRDRRIYGCILCILCTWIHVTYAVVVHVASMRAGVCARERVSERLHVYVLYTSIEEYIFRFLLLFFFFFYMYVYAYVRRLASNANEDSNQEIEAWQIWNHASRVKIMFVAGRKKNMRITVRIYNERINEGKISRTEHGICLMSSFPMIYRLLRRLCVVT